MMATKMPFTKLRCHAALGLRRALRTAPRHTARPGLPLRRAFSNSRPALPALQGEPFLDYAQGSPERQALEKALVEMRAQPPVEIPCVIGGKEIFTGDVVQQVMPSDHGHVLANCHYADAATVQDAIDNSQAAKAEWENMPSRDRAMIFRKTADLIAGPYRAKLNAAVMLGTGKNAWQAEIDASVEMIDFLRHNCKWMEEIYEVQPELHSKNIWNRLEYRPLEGFVLAITPFNFLAIGGNLAMAPAVMGNTVLWKPATTAVLGNYILYQIMMEAGLPPGVINFVPAKGPTVGDVALNSPDFGGLHFTGSTGVFNHLWGKIGENMSTYKSYPRIVGETGGKNFHMVHKSADVENVVNSTIRGAFEYQGQKCSATSRAYFPSNLWPEIKDKLEKEMAQIAVGQPDEMEVFMTAVIDATSFKNIAKYIDAATESKECYILSGGHYDDSKGYFVEPTVIVTTNPHFLTMEEEIFGPVLTVYVYPEDEYEETMDLIDSTSPYALTGAVFAKDRAAIVQAEARLRHCAGNFYINDKSTGAVVGEQPFGGARASGTNDKAGSPLNLYRWVSARSLKENTVPLKSWRYPHME